MHYFLCNTYPCQLQSKTQMLDNLLEIEVAYSMLKTGDDGGQDPLDVHYTQLKTDIKVNYYLFKQLMAEFFIAVPFQVAVMQNVL